MSSSGISKPAGTNMWQILKNSDNVLKDYYDMGNFYMSGNSKRLMELTGKTCGQVSYALRKYRDQDKLNGKTVPPTKFSREQTVMLLEAFEKGWWLPGREMEELKKKTGLRRQQIYSWFSKERYARETGMKRNHMMANKKKNYYFSIENILSDEFPRK